MKLHLPVARCFPLRRGFARSRVLVFLAALAGTAFGTGLVVGRRTVPAALPSVTQPAPAGAEAAVVEPEPAREESFTDGGKRRLDWNGSPEFQAIGRRVLAALMCDDWKRLREVAAPRLVIGQYTRAYLDEFPPGEARSRAFPDLIFSRCEIDAAGVGRYTFLCHSVETNKPPSRETREAFHRFCTLARQGWQISMGEAEPGDEIPETLTSSINGICASNLSWQVELEKTTGRWRVRALTVGLH